MVTPYWKRVFKNTFVTEIVDFEHGFLCEYDSCHCFPHSLKICKRASRILCILEV